MIARPMGVRYNLLLREPRSIARKTMRCHLAGFHSFAPLEKFLSNDKHVRIIAVCYDKGVPMSIGDRIEEVSCSYVIPDDGINSSFLSVLLKWAFTDRCMIHILMTSLDHAALDYFEGDSSEYKLLHITVASIRHHFSDVLVFFVRVIARRRYGRRKGAFWHEQRVCREAFIAVGFCDAQSLASQSSETKTCIVKNNYILTPKKTLNN